MPTATPQRSSACNISGVDTVSLPLTSKPPIRPAHTASTSGSTAAAPSSTYRRFTRRHSSGAPLRRTTDTSASSWPTSVFRYFSPSLVVVNRSRSPVSHTTFQNGTPLALHRFTTRSGAAQDTSSTVCPRR